MLSANSIANINKHDEITIKEDSEPITNTSKQFKTIPDQKIVESKLKLIAQSSSNTFLNNIQTSKKKDIRMTEFSKKYESNQQNTREFSKPLFYFSTLHSDVNSSQTCPIHLNPLPLMIANSNKLFNQMAEKNTLKRDRNKVSAAKLRSKNKTNQIEQENSLRLLKNEENAYIHRRIVLSRMNDYLKELLNECSKIDEN